jgi:hypothetical protein
MGIMSIKTFFVHTNVSKQKQTRIKFVLSMPSANLQQINDSINFYI